MKILMIAPQPFFQPRGTPISVLHRLHTLSNLGHKIDLVTYHLGETVPIENVTYHRITNIPFIKKIKIGPSKSKLILDIFLFLKARHLLRTKEYDVLHAHEEAGFFASLLIKNKKILFLYDMHSSLPQQLTNFKFTKLKSFIHIFEKLENSTITNADAVITICPELYNYVEELFPDKKQVLLENVADNSMVFKDDENQNFNVRDHYELNGNLVILYSGTFEPYQGLDLLVAGSKHVINKFNTVRFLLVGGHADQVEKYRKQVEALGLSSYFVFAGQVKPHEVGKFISAADILVTPRIEGNNTPLKIYEYLRAGKPIVATNHITHTQVLNNQVAYLTECNVESFANGIIRVIEDDDLRYNISENAKILAEKKYSYKVYLSKTRDIYRYLEEKKQLTKESE